MLGGFFYYNYFTHSKCVLIKFNQINFLLKFFNFMFTALPNGIDMARTEDPTSIIVATIGSDREMIVKMVTDIGVQNDRGKFFFL